MFCAFLIVCGLLTHARAFALTQYCTAQVDVWASSSEPTSDYLTILWADESHAVAGKLLFYTKQGWFEAPVAETTLQPSVSTFRTPQFTNVHDGFRSERYAVHFPSDVSVEDIIFQPSDGVLCPPQEVRKQGADWRYGWSPFPDELTHAPYLIAASPAAAPGDTNCEHPFKTALVTQAVPPELPPSVAEQGVDRSATVVELAIGADGLIQDASIFSSSGFPFFDRAAVRAARLSRYTAGRSFCRPSPGNYLFRAEFRVN